MIPSLPASLPLSSTTLTRAGKHLLHSLRLASIPTTYVLLPSLSLVLPRVSLCLLGTHALLSNGAMFSRAGTALVAMMLRERSVPVVCCCETYKFSERVMLDSIVGNERGQSSSFSFLLFWLFLCGFREFRVFPMRWLIKVLSPPPPPVAQQLRLYRFCRLRRLSPPPQLPPPPPLAANPPPLPPLPPPPPMPLQHHRRRRCSRRQTSLPSRSCTTSHDRKTSPSSSPKRD